MKGAFPQCKQMLFPVTDVDFQMKKNASLKKFFSMRSMVCPLGTMPFQMRNMCSFSKESNAFPDKKNAAPNERNVFAPNRNTLSLCKISSFLWRSLKFQALSFKFLSFKL